jgi:hypothetical protein
MKMSPGDFGRALRRAIAPLRAGPGLLVANGPSNDVVSLAPTYRRPPPFPARVTGQTKTGPNQWRYTFVEVMKADAGYGEWVTKSGGRAGDVFNRCEDMNDAAGMEGNGIDIDGADFPSGYAMVPIPVNAIIMVTRFVEATTGVAEYWTEFINAVDGTCDSGLTDDLVLPGAPFCIWAEENQALAAGATEWAFGNGADTLAAGGIPVGLPCDLFRLTAYVNAGTATIQVLKNGTAAGEIACTAGANNAAITPVAYLPGDTLNFQTRLASGTSAPNTVCAWLRTS